MGLLSFLFGSGGKSESDEPKGGVHDRDRTDHDEWENHQRWLQERSKDP